MYKKKIDSEEDNYSENINDKEQVAVGKSDRSIVKQFDKKDFEKFEKFVEDVFLKSEMFSVISDKHNTIKHVGSNELDENCKGKKKFYLKSRIKNLWR